MSIIHIGQDRIDTEGMTEGMDMIAVGPITTAMADSNGAVVEWLSRLVYTQKKKVRFLPALPHWRRYAGFDLDKLLSRRERDEIQGSGDNR